MEPPDLTIGSSIASAKFNRTVQNWNGKTGKCALSRANQRSEMVAVRWSPDEARIASGNGDGFCMSSANAQQTAIPGS